MKAVKTSVVEIPWENPLIPNKRLRQIYVSMAELCLLEQYLATRSRRKKAFSGATGEEACRVSTVLSLLPKDLTSEPIPSLATSFLRGSTLGGLEAAAAADASQLPSPQDSSTRLHIALGASIALGKNGPIVLAYIYPGELLPAEWKHVFQLAAAYTAPMIFVALPQQSKHSPKPGKLSAISTASGVPGIPVDAADAVALYRVVQESMLRARAGGGPVLMECIPFRLAGGTAPNADAVGNMRDSLLHRKVANQAWFDSVATRFAARLAATVL